MTSVWERWRAGQKIMHDVRQSAIVLASDPEFHAWFKHWYPDIWGPFRDVDPHAADGAVADACICTWLGVTSLSHLSERDRINLSKLAYKFASRNVKAIFNPSTGDRPLTRYHRAGASPLKRGTE